MLFRFEFFMIAIKIIKLEKWNKNVQSFLLHSLVFNEPNINMYLFTAAC